MINKKIQETKYKVLFNNLIVESESYLKVIVFYRNGIKFKIYPTSNTLLNKYLLKI